MATQVDPRDAIMIILLAKQLADAEYAVLPTGAAMTGREMREWLADARAKAAER